MYSAYPGILSEYQVQWVYPGVATVLIGDAASESALPIPDRRRLPRHRTTPSDSTVRPYKIEISLWTSYKKLFAFSKMQAVLLLCGILRNAIPRTSAPQCISNVPFSGYL